MSYGKYAPKNISSNNDMANMAYNDPWFTAGMLLAQNWNKNYEDRGMNKYLDEIENKHLAPSKEDMQVASDTLKNDQQQAQMLNYANANSSGVGDFSSFNKALSSGDEMKKAGLMPDYSAPFDRNKLTANAFQANDMAKGISDKNFDKDKALADIRIDMAKRGFSSERQQNILETIAPKFETRQKDVNKNMASQYIQILEGMKAEDLPKAVSTLAALNKVDPDAAKLAVNNFITGKDKWANDQSINKMGLQFDYTQKAADNNLGRQKTLGVFSSGLKMNEKQQELQNKISMLKRAYPNASEQQLMQFAVGGSRGSGSQGTNKEGYDDYKVANDIISKMEKKQEANEAYQPNDVERQALAFRDKYAEARFLGGNTPQERNMNDYNTALPFFSKIIDTGKYSNDQIISGIRQSYNLAPDDNSNEFVESIISSLGLTKQQPKQSDKSEEQSSLTQDGLYAEALKEARAKAEFVNPYTGTPYANNPWFSPNK